MGHANAAEINNTPLGGSLDLNLPNVLRGGSAAGLAIAIQGSFTVSTPGEFSFYGLLTNWTSFGMLVDGVTIRYYDLWNGSSFVQPSAYVHPYDTAGSAYLLPGEHTVTFQLVAKTVASGNPSALFYVNSGRPGVPMCYAKGGQPYDQGVGISGFATSPMFYTVLKTKGH